MLSNKGRFCNTIASVALVHTSIQSDQQMETKDILSSRNSKQTKPQSCPETSTANSRLVRAKGAFQEKVCAYNERRRINLKFCLADFVYLMQNPSRAHCSSSIFISQMYAVTPQLLNQINKICETEL